MGSVTETQQYLTFKLGDEVFALEVANVREILDFETITKVPRTPCFMRGVINLRGSVVPVIDLRLKFGMPETEKTVNTCIIVVEAEMAGGIAVLGALADSVQEVFELEPAQIEPPPRFGSSGKTHFLKGMGQRGANFTMILDMNKLFGENDLEMAREMLTTAA